MPSRFRFAPALATAVWVMWQLHPATAGESPSWRDPSTHQVQRVSVEPQVELEVLDWGGRGQALVLLAGAGNSAHVFDDFAEKLAPQYRVIGISRRGFGASSRPAGGFTPDRLADDVLAVLDALRLQDPILVGHSIANEEMHSFAARYPKRAAGLIYLDAAYDRTLPEGRAPLQELGRKVPPPDPPASGDLKDFRSFQRWSRSARGIALPEAELRQCCEWGVDDRFVGFVTDDARTLANQALGRMARSPDYGPIEIPALAIYAVATSGKDIPGYREQYAAAFEETYSARVPYVTGQASRFRNEVRLGSVVEMRGANHYVFLSNEDEVVGEVRKFAERVSNPTTRGR